MNKYFNKGDTIIVEKIVNQEELKRFSILHLKAYTDLIGKKGIIQRIDEEKTREGYDRLYVNFGNFTKTIFNVEAKLVKKAKVSKWKSVWKEL